MPATRLHITAHQDGSHTRLAVTGELDVATRDDFITAAIAHLNRGAILDLDLSEVSFCDTTGISALIAVRNIATGDGGTVRVTAVSPNVERVLRATEALEVESRNA